MPRIIKSGNRKSKIGKCKSIRRENKLMLYIYSWIP